MWAERKYEDPTQSEKAELDRIILLKERAKACTQNGTAPPAFSIDVFLKVRSRMCMGKAAGGASSVVNDILMRLPWLAILGIFFLFQCRYNGDEEAIES